MNVKRRLRSVFAFLCLIPVGGLLGGCATERRAWAKLPLHVAFVPTVAQQQPNEQSLSGNPTEMSLEFPPQMMASLLGGRLGEGFVRVSPLTPRGENEGPESYEARLIQEAGQCGADVLLLSSIAYAPSINTEINNKFWLNLPLFALGGPFCWLVDDRSYHVHAELHSEIIDVGVAFSRAQHAQTKPRIDMGRLLVESNLAASGASLDFISRASGPGLYLLSCIIPAGFLGAQSDAVPGEVSSAVSRDMFVGMVDGLLRQSAAILAASSVVDFYPRGVQSVSDGGRRFLEGDIVLEMTQVNDLAPLRFRYGTNDFTEAKWLSTAAEDSRQRPDGSVGKNQAKAYRFRVEIRDAGAEYVQLEIRQRDEDLTKRTFTYSLAPVAPK